MKNAHWLLIFLLICLSQSIQAQKRQREIFFKLDEQFQPLKDDFTLKIKTRLGTFIIPHQNNIVTELPYPEHLAPLRVIFTYKKHQVEFFWPPEAHSRWILQKKAYWTFGILHKSSNHERVKRINWREYTKWVYLDTWTDYTEGTTYGRWYK